MENETKVDVLETKSDVVEYKAEDFEPSKIEVGYEEAKAMPHFGHGIAKFEKVSFEEFCRAYNPMYIETARSLAIERGEIKEDDAFAYSMEEFLSLTQMIYDSIELPTRSTVGSAGYDFKFPYGSTVIVPNSTLTIPTGIKCKMDPNWVLIEVPRSSLGFKYRLQFDNTVGIIDSDYYNNEKNEGHIMVKLTNDSRVEGNDCILNQGDRYCQGIFLPYGITVDDGVEEVRTGGLGSTGN